MTLLIIAAVVWVGIHIGLAGTRLRDVAVKRIGEGPFRGAFSLLSVLSIALLVQAWRQAETTPLWYAPNWLRWGLAAVMLLAFVLFAASLTQRNPTAVGGGAAMSQPPRGILRVTRHPMLWSFALWAAAHIIGNGDTAATVFFGAFLITALFGMPSIDAKLARRDPAAWRTLAAATSILPFGAIAARRNRLASSEIGWLAPLIGVVAWAALLHLHPWLFGVPPVAM